MHYKDATNIYDWWTNESRTPANPGIGFVSPAVSTIIAAAAVNQHKVRSVECADNCKAYADMIGLTEAIKGEPPIGIPSALEGATLSRLTKLHHESEVESCNRIISDLLHTSLDGASNAGFIDAIIKVAGELHDNVPSHAAGTGFSAAQVYCNQGGCRLEFAIADGGRGMLYNVRKVVPAITTHQEALEWCLQRGNTTAKNKDDSWAQKVPDDMAVSPFGDSVSTYTSENHHIGEGLYCLTELIRMAEGQLWAWTGNAQLLILPDGRKEWISSDLNWNGLAIELELDFGKAQALQDQDLSPDLEEIAGRLGL